MMRATPTGHPVPICASLRTFVGRINEDRARTGQLSEEVVGIASRTHSCSHLPLFRQRDQHGHLSLVFAIRLSVDVRQITLFELNRD